MLDFFNEDFKLGKFILLFSLDFHLPLHNFSCDPFPTEFDPVGPCV